MLDADTRGLLQRLIDIKAPHYEDLDPAAARAAMAAARIAVNVPAPSVDETRDLEIAGRSGPIRIRFYRPGPRNATAPGEPALIFFHGGGWVVGDLASHDILCRKVALASGACILSVDYRLAPECRFPGAVEDSVDAVRWVFSNAPGLGIDSDCIGVGGDSAGGNLAAVMAIMARDGQLPALKFQLLAYPVTDLTMAHPSYAVSAEGLPVTRPTMEWFRSHYLSTEAEQHDWRASPLRAERLDGVAPAYVLTAGYDPLADEGAAYATRLRTAGIRVVHSHYPGQVHAFLTLGGLLPTTQRAVQELGLAVRLGLAPRIPLGG